MSTNTATIPLFDSRKYPEYTISYLAVKLGRSEGSLLSYKRGYKPLTQSFRIYAAAVLGKTQEELFGPSG